MSAKKINLMLTLVNVIVFILIINLGRDFYLLKEPISNLDNEIILIEKISIKNSDDIEVVFQRLNVLKDSGLNLDKTLDIENVFKNILFAFEKTPSIEGMEVYLQYIATDMNKWIPVGIEHISVSR